MSGTSGVIPIVPNADPSGFVEDPAMLRAEITRLRHRLYFVDETLEDITHGVFGTPEATAAADANRRIAAEGSPTSSGPRDTTVKTGVLTDTLFGDYGGSGFPIAFNAPLSEDAHDLVSEGSEWAAGYMVEVGGHWRPVCPINTYLPTEPVQVEEDDTEPREPDPPKPPPPPPPKPPPPARKRRARPETKAQRRRREKHEDYEREKEEREERRRRRRKGDTPPEDGEPPVKPHERGKSGEGSTIPACADTWGEGGGTPGGGPGVPFDDYIPPEGRFGPKAGPTLPQPSPHESPSGAWSTSYAPSAEIREESAITASAASPAVSELLGDSGAGRTVIQPARIEDLDPSDDVRVRLGGGPWHPEASLVPAGGIAVLDPYDFNGAMTVPDAVTRVADRLNQLISLVNDRFPFGMSTLDHAGVYLRPHQDHRVVEADNPQVIPGVFNGTELQARVEGGIDDGESVGYVRSAGRWVRHSHDAMSDRTLGIADARTDAVVRFADSRANTAPSIAYRKTEAALAVEGAPLRVSQLNVTADDGGLVEITAQDGGSDDTVTLLLPAESGTLALTAAIPEAAEKEALLDTLTGTTAKTYIVSTTRSVTGGDTLNLRLAYRVDVVTSTPHTILLYIGSSTALTYVVTTSETGYINADVIVSSATSAVCAVSVVSDTAARIDEVIDCAYTSDLYIGLAIDPVDAADEITVLGWSARKL